MSRKTRTHVTAGGKSPGSRPAARPETAAAAPPSSIRPPSFPVATGLLALVSIVAYWNSFGGELIWDNKVILLQDIRLRSIDWQSVANIFTYNYWWPSFESDLFRPLTTLSYWFNYSVLGNAEQPFGYHAVNLLLHVANASLVFWLVRDVTRKPWVALVSGAVLAAHPLTVESVTNVIGRADLLAALSTFGGLCAYRRFLRDDGGRRTFWLAILGATYVGGVFSKESAVVLPGLMVLHDAAFPAASGRTLSDRARQIVARVWPGYVAVVPGLAALVAARWAVLHNSPLPGQFASDNPLAIADVGTRVMTAVKVMGYYLSLIVWPATLSVDRSYNEITLFGWTLASGQDPQAWLALAIVVALVGAAVALWRRHRDIVFFLGVAAVSFLPTANLFFPIGTIMGERFMYVPLVGIATAVALAVAWAGETLAAGRPDARRSLTVGLSIATSLVIGALAVRTMVRNGDWTSNMALCSSTVNATPNNYKGYRGLAAAIMESDPSGGRLDEAIETAMRGLRIVEQAPLPLYHMPSGLYCDLGFYNVQKGERLVTAGRRAEAQPVLVEAIRLLKRAEAIDGEINRRGRENLVRSGLAPATIHDVGNPAIYRNLGSAYLLADEPEQAIVALGFMQRIQPGNFDAHYARGLAEAALAQKEKLRGNDARAAEHLDRAAVNLVAATLLNRDFERTWQVLASVYNYLTAAPPAVVLVDGRPGLNSSNPVVWRHIQEASAQLVRGLHAAGQSGEAERLRQRMISEFHVPPEAFATAGSGP